MDAMIYVFDMFGVVLDWGSEYVMKDWAKLAGTTESKFKEKSAKDFDLAETGKIGMKEFWSNLGETFRCSDKSLETLLEKRFAERAKLNGGVVRIIEDLKKAGYTVVLLSNQLPVHGVWCSNSGWFDYFDRVFLSYEIGHRKPSADAYRFVQSKLGVNPGELFLVDDKAANVSAAVELGWRGVVFTSDVQLSRDLKSMYPAKVVRKSDAA
jgi:putative hydrolase of the HAD superfamily